MAGDVDVDDLYSFTERDNVQREIAAAREQQAAKEQREKTEAENKRSAEMKREREETARKIHSLKAQ